MEYIFPLPINCNIILSWTIPWLSSAALHHYRFLVSALLWLWEERHLAGSVTAFAFDSSAVLFWSHPGLNILFCFKGLWYLVVVILTDWSILTPWVAATPHSSVVPSITGCVSRYEKYQWCLTRSSILWKFDDDTGFWWHRVCEYASLV
jgi:hypothetical protein